MKSLIRFVTRFIRDLLRYPINFLRRVAIKQIWQWIMGFLLAFVLGGGIINMALPLNQKLVADVQKAEQEDLGFFGNVFYDVTNGLVRFFDYRTTLEYLKNGLNNAVDTAGESLSGVNVTFPTIGTDGSQQPDTSSQPQEQQSSQEGETVQMQGEVREVFQNPPMDLESFNFDYYALNGKSGIDPSMFPSPGIIQYSQLDSMGRTQVARGSLTFANVQGSYGKREKFPSSAKPSGWGAQDKVSIYWRDPSTGEERPYNGFFYNRSHLIADSLGGYAERNNLITGTRTQNVGGSNHKGGMRYSEDKAKAYLEANQSVVVYYEAEPVYIGSEAVPRGVVVRMLSSDGVIDETVLVYNNAFGYQIDYQTGFFKAV